MTSHDLPPGAGRLAWVTFGGLALMVNGVVQIGYGLAALGHSGPRMTRSGSPVMLDFSTPGWTLVLLGTAVLVAGAGVLSGRIWARVLGVVVAVVSALSGMAFFVIHPLWSTVVVIIDVAAIYALAVRGNDLR